MNENLKKNFGTIIFIIIIVFAILWYPWFISTENGETRCYNILGFTMKCD